MNRADLSWILSAVLPHAGKWVGLESRDGYLYAYATDRYTLGIARTAPFDGVVDAQLPTTDARDLERFVRATAKRDQGTEVQLVQSGRELHVGYDDKSEVYDTADDFAYGARLTLSGCEKQITKLRNAPKKANQLMRPQYFTRFAKCVRLDVDTVLMSPLGGASGGWYVVAGDSFIGAVAGVTGDQYMPQGWAA